jgi:hypothetical protein
MDQETVEYWKEQVESRASELVALSNELQNYKFESDKLAAILITGFGGPVGSESAVEMAIRLLFEQSSEMDKWRSRYLKSVNSFLDDLVSDCESDSNMQQDLNPWLARIYAALIKQQSHKPE